MAIPIWGVTSLLGVSAETLNITGAVWCPYNCYPAKARPGIMLEIIRSALGKQGYTVTYTELPWSRGVRETGAGKYDALIGAAKVDAPHFIYPNESIAIARNCFFVRKETEWRYNGIPSLSQAYLGVGQDESVNEDIDAYIDKYKETNRVQVVSGTDYMDRQFSKLKHRKIL